MPSLMRLMTLDAIVSTRKTNLLKGQEFRS